MPRGVSKSTVAVIVVGIAVTIVAYSVFGIVFAYFGTAIDTDLPKGSFNFYRAVELIVSNRSPFALPFIVPIYSVGVRLVNATRTVCTLDTVRGWLPCNETLGALGNIPAGEYRSAHALITPGPENFTIEVDAYYSWFIPIRIATKSYECVYLGPGEYDIKG
jgi:hypothetical protein